MPNRPSVSRRAFCTSLAAGAAALSLGRRARGQGAGSRPNIVLVTGDDLGPQLGCYGDAAARTPHLGRLAGQSVRFTNAYVTQASCSPSRSSILTGTYPHQNGQWGLSHRGYSMRDGMATLPAMLKQQGYRTGIIGKLHVAPEKAFPFDYAEKNAGQTRDVALAASRARTFLEESAGEPFFLMFNLFDPHRPLEHQIKGVPARPRAAGDVPIFPFHGSLDSPRMRDEVAGYYNCVERLDQGMGLLMEALEQSGRLEDTLILVVGDHGPPFTRGKTTCYEAGVKVPLLMRRPGGENAGAVSDALVSTVDFVPTVAEAVGCEPPAGVAGASLLGLAGAAPPPWRTTLGTEYHSHHQGGWYPRRALRDERYKLILNLLPERDNPIKGVDGCAAFNESREARYEGTPIRAVMDRHLRPPAVELFDLEVDPNEFDNLAGRPELRDTEARMLTEMERWRTATADPFLDPAVLAEQTRLHDEAARQPK